MRDKVLVSPLDVDPFAASEKRLSNALTRRVNADPESVERGLAQLVLTIVELLRQLMDAQVERLGQTFMELDRRMAELTEQFGLTADDLNLDLGPLGRLL